MSAGRRTPPPSSDPSLCSHTQFSTAEGQRVSEGVTPRREGSRGAPHRCAASASVSFQVRASAWCVARKSLWPLRESSTSGPPDELEPPVDDGRGALVEASPLPVAPPPEAVGFSLSVESPLSVEPLSDDPLDSSEPAARGASQTDVSGVQGGGTVIVPIDGPGEAPALAEDLVVPLEDLDEGAEEDELDGAGASDPPGEDPAIGRVVAGAAPVPPPLALGDWPCAHSRGRQVRETV